MPRLSLLLAGVALLAGLPQKTAAAAPPVSYGRDVRPILAENCFFCHGQDPNHRKADLRLDTRDGQKAEGVILAGKPDESELIARIVTDEKSRLMPPPKSNRHLTAAQKETLRRWVAEGAKFEEHWAFVAPARPPLPGGTGGRNPIDRFLAVQFAAKGLKPMPEADKVTLIRRLTLDLLGLPPTPADVDAFVADTRPDAYERLVERLLADPRYGERMALPWLDAARYADSNGFQQDGDTFQWVWRDWVVRAMNANMPFDRFTIEQLAGDLLPNATVEQKIATAFNRNHLVNGEGGAIPEEQRFNNLFDRVDTTATNWLGLTLACAQCHDHKYDPLTQRDYYGLMAGFNQLSESGVAGRQTSRVRVSPPFLDVATPEQKAEMAAREKKVAELKKLVEDMKRLAPAAAAKVAGDLDAEVKKAEAAVSAYRDDYPLVMVMADDKPRDTHVLDRGEYLKPKEKVAFATPAFLPPLPSDAPRNRLGLARWLVAAENPLVARVAVNRQWQTFFGTGLVKTSEDFGVQSEVPIHQELLDWLAVEFRESGWDVKRLQRMILTSDAYRRSSRTTPEQLAADPENRLLGRFPRVRLPAIVLRDIALSASGLLDGRMAGRPVYPYQPSEIWAPLAITKERDFTYPASHGADLYKRSLYTFWRRTVGPANMFDGSARQTCRVRTSVTNTPLHALTTLNDPTWTEAARVLAERVLKRDGNVDERLTFAFRQILTRSPRERELAVLKRMLDQQREHFAKDKAAAAKSLAVGESPRDGKLDAVEHAAWAAVCLALFNLDEALTRE